MYKCTRRAKKAQTRGRSRTYIHCDMVSSSIAIVANRGPDYANKESGQTLAGPY